MRDTRCARRCPVAVGTSLFSADSFHRSSAPCSRVPYSHSTGFKSLAFCVIVANYAKFLSIFFVFNPLATFDLVFCIFCCLSSFFFLYSIIRSFLQLKVCKTNISFAVEGEIGKIGHGWKVNLYSKTNYMESRVIIYCHILSFSFLF